MFPIQTPCCDEAKRMARRIGDEVKSSTDTMSHKTSSARRRSCARQTEHDGRRHSSATAAPFARDVRESSSWPFHQACHGRPLPQSIRRASRAPEASQVRDCRPGADGGSAGGAILCRWRPMRHGRCRPAAADECKAVSELRKSGGWSAGARGRWL